MFGAMSNGEAEEMVTPTVTVAATGWKEVRQWRNGTRWQVDGLRGRARDEASVTVESVLPLQICMVSIDAARVVRSANY